MKFKIKTFVSGKRRPDWLLKLLIGINFYVKKDDINDCELNSIFNCINSLIDETVCIKRNSRYKLRDCVNIYEEGNKLTIRTIHKDTPMVEFSIE